jgi:hypothetical protein
MAGPFLAARAEQVAAIERASVVSTPGVGGSPAPAPVPSAAAQPKPVRRRKVLALGAALGLAVVLLLGVNWRARNAPPKAPGSVALGNVARDPTTSPPMADPPALSTARIDPPARTSISGATPRRTMCNPPYWYDSRGIKHYRIECGQR